MSPKPAPFSTKAFTPGPWRVSTPMTAGPARYLHIIGPKLSDGVVAKVMAKRPDDAHLVAAAPELFEIVQSLATFDARNSIVHLREMAASRLAKLEAE